MVDIGRLTAQPLGPGRDFTWIFLVELVVCGILTLFFLFYFNRLFATVISYGIRAYTWHKFRVYVDIQALQISLLGGRIFFKGVRYHGENETIIIQHGFITWNYWLRAVRQPDCARYANINSKCPAGSTDDAGGMSASASAEADAHEAGEAKPSKDLPSRISVSVSGVEWFMYNRSLVYDTIAASQVIGPRQQAPGPAYGDQCNPIDPHRPKQQQHFGGDGLSRQQPASSPMRRSSESTTGSQTKSAVVDAKSGPCHVLHSDSPEHDPSFLPSQSKTTTSSVAEAKDDLPAAAPSSILAFFPLAIECQKGAIVIGNENTRVISTTCFDRCRGLVDATKSTPRDKFRQTFEFDVVRPVVRMRPNPDYRQSQQSAARHAIRDPSLALKKRSWWNVSGQSFRRRKRRVVRDVRNLVPYFRGSVDSFSSSPANEKSDGGRGVWPCEVPGESRWLGLSRYLDENYCDDHEGWSAVEYARFSNVVDCPSVHINLYWDVPGPVQPELPQNVAAVGDQNINRAKPPAYGLDLTVRGGSINYGPWADRARVELQSIFFPNPYQDTDSADALLVGTLRQSTEFNLNVHLENETSFRIPTRENSKDRQWKGRVTAFREASDTNQHQQKKNAKKKKGEALLGPDVRPFGWFNASVSANSTITFNLDLVAGKAGYRNKLELDLGGTRMTTSVNHALLWRCGRQKISCDLSNPLGWNSPHEWFFECHSEEMELFLLRDHVFLLTDLITDFTSGPPSDFLTFVPFLYHLKLTFDGVQLSLNVNDANIIDSPCDFDENSFLTLFGERLEIVVDIPLQNYAPSQNKVDFKAWAKDARLDVTTPVWNTARSFGSGMPIATLDDFSMEGAYSYFTSTSPDFTDTLFLDLGGTAPRIYLYGSLIRQCVKLKDNYGGDDVHFRTLEEHQELLFKPKVTDDEALASQSKNVNDLDIILNIMFHRVCVLLPANIYSRKENLRLDFLSVETDIRFTNYYMDLEAKFSPIKAAWETNKAEEGGKHDFISNTQAFVDGVTIYGHRLFGAPPTEPTYVCNWDFDIGKVTGDGSADFLRILFQSLRSFAFTLDDDENALPESRFPPIHDITFLRAHVNGIKLWVMVDEAAILLEAGQIDLMFNDWAGEKFSDRLKLGIPDIKLAVIDHKSGFSGHKEDSPVLTHALFQSSLSLKMVQRKGNFAHEREMQQQHVFFHDQWTDRTAWLLGSQSQTTQPQPTAARLRSNPPAMPIPHMPAPLSRDEQKGVPRLNSDFQLRKKSLASKQFDKVSSSSSYSCASSYSLHPMREYPRSTRPRNHPRSRQESSRLSSRAENGSKAQPFKLDDIGSWSSDSSVGEKVLLASKPSQVCSSPWTSPSFHLQDFVPDAKDLPAKLPDTHGPTTESPSFDDVEGAFEDSEETNGTVHTRIDISLGSAVRAFATPLSFSAIAALLQALHPIQPTDLLDDLQISTMSRILKFSNIGAELCQRTDMCVRIPFMHFRLLNSGSLWQTISNGAINDQYDFQVLRTEAFVRSNLREKHQNHQTAVERGLRLQLVVEKTILEVQDQSSHMPGEVAARASLESILFSTVSDGHIRAKFRQKALKVTSYGNRIGFLASLLRRTTNMLDFIAGQFRRPDKLDRFERLVYHLTDAAKEGTDPLCLTRPSYVLRVADEHLRLHDSWKIISRLRYMFQTLSGEHKLLLIRRISPDTSLPPNAQATVLSKFDDWRSWDLAHVKRTLIMEQIWRKARSVNGLEGKPSDKVLEFTLETVKILLDPGARESRIDIQNVRTSVSMTTGTSDVGEKDDGKELRLSVFVIESYCSRFGVYLNWDLVRLVDETQELFLSRQDTSNQSKPSSLDGDHTPRSVKQIQMFIGTDSSVIVINGINITTALAVSGLKGSFLHRLKPDDSNEASIAVGTNAISVKLKHRERVLLGWLFDSFTLCLSQTVPTSKTVDAVALKMMGRCEALRFEIKEDICECLRIADCVMRDEMNIVKALVSQFSSHKVAVEPQEHNSQNLLPRFHVALILDQYSLSVAILPQLTYVVSGSLARISILPRSAAHMTIDLDIGEHSHAFKIRSKEKTYQIVDLTLPAINGRLIVSQDSSPTKIDVEVTMDKVELDARSVRAFIDVVNKPEAFRALFQAKSDAQQLSSRWHTSESSGLGAISTRPESSTTLLYTAHLSFIGLRVHASAPALKSDDYRADLEFVVGLASVHIWNQGLEGGSGYDSPQFDVAIRLISLELQRHSIGQVVKCGNLDFGGKVTKRTKLDDKNSQISMFHASSDRFDANLHPEAAYLVVDIAAYLQGRLKSFTLTDEARRLKPLRRFTIGGLTEASNITITNDSGAEDAETKSSKLFDSVYSIELNAIKVAWRLDRDVSTMPSTHVEDLLFSIRRVKLDTKREGSATLAIALLQLQMAPKSLARDARSSNSALMPEIIFKVAYLSTKKDRRFAFQAAGKALDLRLASDFIVPAAAICKSLAAAHAELREGRALWAAEPASSRKGTNHLFGKKYLASLLVDADFAGAVVSIQGSAIDSDQTSATKAPKGGGMSPQGHYGHRVQDANAARATLRAPGVALKIGYSAREEGDPALNAEVKVAASSNVLYPSVVPLIIQISSSVKGTVGGAGEGSRRSPTGHKIEVEKPATNSSLASSNPANLMGRCKLNLGLWIREQKFSLSCQPIARVAATARFNHIFMAMNSVPSTDVERFFALSTNFSGFHASVQHVYSRESTASFEVDSIVHSMMNSKHVSNTTGLSAILNVSPMKASINAKQLQDFLLFREIWYPAELRKSSTPTTVSTGSDSQGFVVQKYQQVAAAGAFPWKTAVSIQELKVKLDLGQSLGKTTFTISKLWASSKKASDFEQNLCIGFDTIGVESTGRMSGDIELRNFRLRTSIRWPQTPQVMKKTPLVQASLGLDEFRAKVVFDYQPFAVAEISKFNFLMYNVSGVKDDEKDRLVGNLEGDKVQVFCTTSTASQGYGLYQALVRLTQENEGAYQTSLKELDKHLRRKSAFPSSTLTDVSTERSDWDREGVQGPFSLHTDVVVALQAVNIGVFPSTFFDNQIFKVEAKDAEARFAVSVRDGKTRSGLGLTLGQLRVALSSVNRINTQVLGEVSVSDVVSRATGSRGGTILRVPKAIASMQTWQSESSNKIEYTFKSTFEGKVDVGWNYSRISFIRGMWATHSQSLASRLGKPLPQSAVQITGGPQPDDTGQESGSEKITAVVNVPQSRFEYTALEPPIMETPQLRDMGEATPPLEWIGLNRDKLPHVTHQIIIVALLEVAKKVEDAYSKILGSSP